MKKGTFKAFVLAFLSVFTIASCAGKDIEWDKAFQHDAEAHWHKSVDGESTSIKAGHEYIIKSDATGHWKECKYCGEKAPVDGHTFGWLQVVTEPTYTTVGLGKRVCTLCGFEKTEEIPVLVNKEKGTAANPFTVLEAIKVIGALEDNVYSDEMIYVKGVVKSASFSTKYNNWTIYLEAGTATFEFYAATLAEGVQDPFAGAEIVAYGYYEKYVKAGSAPVYELTWKTVGEDRVYPQVISVTGEVKPVELDYGKKGEELGVAKALAQLQTTVTESGATSAAEYFVKGKVVSCKAGNQGSYNFMMADLLDETKRIQGYSPAIAAGLDDSIMEVGNIVCVKGVIVFYKGTTYEFDSTGELYAIEQLEYPLAKFVENATTTLPEKALAGNTVNFEVTVAEGFELKSVSYGNVELEPVEGVYSFKFNPSLEVKVTAAEKKILIPAKETRAVALDLVGNYAEYSAGIGTSYTTNTLSFAQVGEFDFVGQITANPSNVQSSSSAIHDLFVLSGKPGTSVVLKVNGEFSVREVSFDLHKWSDANKYKDIHIEVSADGETWTAIETVNGIDNETGIMLCEGAVHSILTVSAKVEALDVRFVKLVVSSGISDKAAQCGLGNINLVLGNINEELPKPLVLATAAKPIYNAEGKVAADLADDWSIKKYTDSWVDCGASMDVTKDDANKDALLLKYWDNTVAFRFETIYEKLEEGYKNISFTAQGNGISALTVRLASQEFGIYMDYKIEKITKGWADYVISFKDPNWKIATGQGTFTFEQLKAAGYIDEEIALPMQFDTLDLILRGNTSNGANAKAIFSNIRFDIDLEETSITAHPVKEANVELTFDDGAGSGKYNGANWYQQYYGNSGWTDWVKISEAGNGSQMNSRAVSGNKNANLYTSGYTYQYKYEPNGGIGIVNYFEAKIGNYWSGGADAKLKVYLLLVDGTREYIVGDTNNFHVLPKDTANSYSLIIKQAIAEKDVQAIVFTTYKVSADTYVYIDDVKALFAAPSVPTLPELNTSEDFDTYGSLPGSVKFAPSNVYFKTDNKGYEGSKCYLSVFTTGGNTVTYTLPQEGGVKSFTFASKNNFNPRVTTEIQVDLYDGQNNLVGSKKVTVEAGADWALFTVDVEGSVAKVVFNFYPDTKAEGYDSSKYYYCYLDHFVFAN